MKISEIKDPKIKKYAEWLRANDENPNLKEDSLLGAFLWVNQNIKWDLLYKAAPDLPLSEYPAFDYPKEFLETLETKNVDYPVWINGLADVAHPKKPSPKRKEHFTKALPIVPTNHALEVIGKVPITQETMSDFTVQLMKALNEGEINPLDLKIQLKALSMIQDVIKHRMDELALNECDKHGKKFDYRGFEVAVQEMGVQYDYSNCGDIVLQDLESKAKFYTDEIKNRQAMLKTLNSMTPLIHPGTGEAFEVVPPVKKSTTTIVLKLKK